METKVSFWENFFKTDKDWLEAKAGTVIDENKTLSRLEILKQTGSDIYNEDVYQNYLNQLGKKVQI